jgi:cell wall-associated NlpC family hydrolase
MPAFAVALALLLAAPTPGAVLKTARRFLGQSYVYGGSGRGGFDCSGFVQTVFGRHGVRLPRTAHDQAMSGKPISITDIRPGDLLFFTEEPGGIAVTHVGIATDSEHMIHASTGRRRILIDRTDLPYYRERLLFARRVLRETSGRKAQDSPSR